MRTTYPTGRFSKNRRLNKHNRHVALLKAKSSTSTVVIGDSTAAGLMRYRNAWDENFCRDTVNCEIGDKTHNVLWRSNNITQVCGNKLWYEHPMDTDNPDEISDGLICIALLFQKLLKHLQIIVNGIIPRDATNTRRRLKLLEVNQLLRDKCTSYSSVYFLKPDTGWTTLDGGLNKTLYYKDNTHLLEDGNKKLAVSIKTKLDNIRINCHEIAINENFLPTIKTVDYQRTDYRRAITTS